MILDRTQMCNEWSESRPDEVQAGHENKTKPEKKSCRNRFSFLRRRPKLLDRIQLLNMYFLCNVVI